MWARIAMGAGFAALVAFTSPAFAETKAHYFGHWVNEDAATKNIVYIDISNGPGNKIRVHAYGKCTPTPCDWGTVFADRIPDGSGFKYRAAFNQGFAMKHLMLNINPIGTLRVTTTVRFTDGSGRTDYAKHEIFRH